MSGSWWRALGLFVLTFIIASVEKWTPTDIVWSMWIASLVTGYLWIIGTIIFSGYMLSAGFNETTLEKFAATSGAKKPLMEKPPLVALLVFGVFLLGFFTVHFVGFHWGHSMFLRQFFPLPGVGVETGLPDVIKITVLAYFPMVVLTLIDRSRAFLADMRESKAFNMFAPYAAVVKNHIMIIFIGFLSLFLKQNWMLWILLVFYFFPWEEIFAKSKADKQPATMAD